jgi:hypothetical protein
MNLEEFKKRSLEEDDWALGWEATDEVYMRKES